MATTEFATTADNLKANLASPTFTGVVTVAANGLKQALTTPASAAAAGVEGTIVWDAGFIYVCTATDTWERVAIATW